MKKICSVLAACLITASPFYAAGQTAFNDPKNTLKEEFWGKLYANGGKTLICKKEFSKKSILVTESYIYSSLWIRDILDCGTPRQCRENSERYRQLTSDLHNIYPEDARFELERRAAKFEELDDSVPLTDCDIKRVFGVIEPPDVVKGDIARSLFYMHTTYDLPLYGDLNQLKRWHRADPPSKEEINRNNAIKALQGNDNIYIVKPETANNLTIMP